MKQSELKKHKLKDIAEITIGLTYKPADVSNKGTLVIRSSNIQEAQFINRGDDVYVGKVVSPNLSVLKNDIIMCARNGSKNLIGKNAIMKKDFENATFGAFMVRIRSKYNEYLYQYFNSHPFIKYLHRDMGATINQVTTRYLGNMTINLPSDTTQKKIADILSTWDYAIELKEDKIKFIKKYLNAVIQRFSRQLFEKIDYTNWDHLKLSNVFKRRNIKEYESDDLELYSFTIENGVTSKTNRYNREFLVRGNKKYKVTKFNDLVFNPANLKYGAISVNENDEDVLISPIYETLVIKDKSKYDIEFFKHFLTTSEMISYYKSKVEGTLVERSAVKADQFLLFKIYVPDYQTQKYISSFLNKLDTMIIKLTREVDQLKLQKQGLMQQLLTGKIRVQV